jgi:FlaA1/EpsC-like NDP-sugar epimerase
MASTLLLKRASALLHDLVAVAACWLLAYWLRFNFDVPESFLSGALKALALVLCVHAPIFWFFGLYRGIWRYASLMDLRRIILAVGFASMVVAAAVFMLAVADVPRSVLVLHPLVLVLVMGGSRFTYRAWRDRLLYGRMVIEGDPVLVIGSGDAADRLLR